MKMEEENDVDEEVSLLLMLLVLSCVVVDRTFIEDYLKRICPKTIDPSFCMQALKSDPRRATTDLRGLAEITIVCWKPMPRKRWS